MKLVTESSVYNQDERW